MLDENEPALTVRAFGLSNFRNSNGRGSLSTVTEHARVRQRELLFPPFAQYAKDGPPGHLFCLGTECFSPLEVVGLHTNRSRGLLWRRRDLCSARPLKPHPVGQEPAPTQFVAFRRH